MLNRTSNWHYIYAVLTEVHFVTHIFLAHKRWVTGPNLNVLFSLPSPLSSQLHPFYVIIPKLLLNFTTGVLSFFSNFVIAAINFILVKEGRLEGSAWVIQQRSGVFGVPVTTPQFVQTCLQLSPVQRHKQELIAVTNSFFPLLPSGSFSCEVSSNKHVTREAMMTQSRLINYSSVILGHTLRNSLSHLTQTLWY